MESAGCCRIWKIAGALLFPLMSISLGCQGSGDHLRNHAANDSPSACPPQEQPPQPVPRSEQSEPTTTEGGVAPAVAVAPANGDSGILQIGTTQISPPAERTASSSYVDSLMGAPPLPVDNGAEVPNKKWTAAPPDKGKADEKRKETSDQGVYRVDRTLPSPDKGMSIPTIPHAEKVRSLTLAAALARAGVENPILNIARQAVVSALGLQLQARALLLPSINIGADYDNHNGPLQSSFGAIRKVDRQSVFYGLGAYTVAAETLKIPGLLINTPLTDAIFEPRAARYNVANRRFQATATRNDIFLEVSLTYLVLMHAEARLAIIRQSERDFEEVARLTASFAKQGKGRYGDANRAEADLLALRYEEQQAQQDVAVASADLAQLLNLDPSTRLVTGDIPLQIVQFIDPTTPLPKLLEIAEQNHPAIQAASAAIRESQIRVRQEVSRPLLPNLWIGFSSGNFGGGAVSTERGTGVFNPHTGNANLVTIANGHTLPVFGKIGGRVDVDVLAYWQLQNMGFGNLGRIRKRRAQRRQAEAARLRILNEVREQVSIAYNTAGKQFRNFTIKRRWVQDATEGFQRDLITSFGGEVLPIEVLDNAKRLRKGREDLLKAIIGFDRAQFQLFVALGQPPTLVVEDDKTPPPSPAP